MAAHVPVEVGGVKLVQPARGYIGPSTAGLERLEGIRLCGGECRMTQL